MLQGPLTFKDVCEIAQHYAEQDNWEGARQFAHELYGPRAQQIQLEVYWTIEKHGSPVFIIEAIHVFDDEWNVLSPDLMLPFWRNQAQVLGGTDYVEKRMRAVILQEAQHRLTAKENTLYDLGVSPHPDLPLVFLTPNQKNDSREVSS